MQLRRPLYVGQPPPHRPGQRERSQGHLVREVLSDTGGRLPRTHTTNAPAEPCGQPLYGGQPPPRRPGQQERSQGQCAREVLSARRGRRTGSLRSLAGAFLLEEGMLASLPAHLTGRTGALAGLSVVVGRTGVGDVAARAGRGDATGHHHTRIDIREHFDVMFREHVYIMVIRGSAGCIVAPMGMSAAATSVALVPAIVTGVKVGVTCVSTTSATRSRRGVGS